MGGQLVRHKPMAHEALIQDPQLMQEFANYGWLNYFLRIDSFDEEAAGEFLRIFQKMRLRYGAWQWL